MRVRIGTRKSKLALWQANRVKKLLESMHKIEVELVKITTTGDKILDSPLAKIGGKGLFVKEIENALISGHIDLAVHSLKDVPMELPEELTLGAVLEREAPYDVLISARGEKLKELPEGAKIGTSSLRRQVQILRQRRDLKVETLRGNVDTRIKKLMEGKYDAIILAMAGVKRMGYEKYITEVLDYFTPSVGQGSIAVEIRKDDLSVRELIAPIDHEHSRIRATCERAFLKELEGGCQVPMGAISTLGNDSISIKGFISDLEGVKFIEGVEKGPKEKAEQVGRTLAQKLLNMGGKDILESIYGRGE